MPMRWHRNWIIKFGKSTNLMNKNMQMVVSDGDGNINWQLGIQKPNQIKHFGNHHKIKWAGCGVFASFFYWTFMRFKAAIFIKLFHYMRKKEIFELAKIVQSKSAKRSERICHQSRHCSKMLLFTQFYRRCGSLTFMVFSEIELTDWWKEKKFVSHPLPRIASISLHMIIASYIFHSTALFCGIHKLRIHD